ncbi:MAG: hypothetical protein R3D69_14830 [Xanthobacteraceae bacterium]
MKAAGVALAAAVIGTGAIAGYLAADAEHFSFVGTRLFESPFASRNFPAPNSENKADRIRADASGLRAELSEPVVLPKADALRQSFAAVDPLATGQQALADPAPPLPKARPKAMLLRRQQASYTLLSDLQIEAIKERLKLSAEQERYWPPLEAALRGLSTRLHDMKQSGQSPTRLASDAEEIAQLKAAATPFFSRLSAEQKRQLRMLAHLIGLGRVVAQL